MITQSTENPLNKIILPFDQEYSSTYNHITEMFKQCSKISGLKLFHLNIASKLDQLRVISTSVDFHVLSINESRLDTSFTDFEIEINSFTVFRKDRNRKGGGVCLYIKTNLAPIQLSNNLLNDDILETVWVTITSYDKQIIVGSIYRPPSSTITYWNNLSEQVNYVLSLNKEVIILGDFNLYFSNNPNICDKKITEFANVFSLTQLISVPTRATVDTESIIDLIFTTSPENHSKSGVIPITLSDHFLVFTVLNFKIPKPKMNIISNRNYKNVNELLFLKDIALSSNLSRIFYISDVDVAWNIWIQEFTRICNKYAPLRDHKVKDHQKPWITKDIITLMQDRDHWHNKALKSKAISDMNQYRLLRNQVTCYIRNAKKSFVLNELHSYQGKPDKTWKILKQFLPKKNINSSGSPEMDADSFNDFFSSIGEHTTKHYGPVIVPTLPVQTNHIFNIPPITIEFINKYLNTLPKSTALDFLNIDNNLLRISSECISPSLCHIYNLSLINGIVPIQ